VKQVKDYIIFPLDMPSSKEAQYYVELLSEHVGMFKLGLELFIRSGPEIINIIKSTGNAKIFLDLKLHDIPVTVFRAMEAIADLGITFTTVHCGETEKMLESAVTGGKGKTGILAVTVLTSVSNTDIKQSGFVEKYFSDISGLVLKRATMAKKAGCTGVICSGLETRLIKKTLGENFITVTPGIRPCWDDVEANDQNRITTPAQAILNGSDYIVVGRPIRDAKRPKIAAIKIAEEIMGAIL